MKKLAMLFLLALLPAFGQTIPSTANITAQDSGACSTAGACLTVNVPNQAASSVVQLTGTWSATIQFEGTTSVGGTFVAVNAVPVGGTTAVTSATGNGAWRIAVAGLAQVRVRCSAFSSGPAVAAITLSTGSSANNTSGGGGGAVSSVFTRTGAVTATSGDYTLDQIGNPASAKTFALGTNNPLAFSSAGTFTATQMNEYDETLLNSCSPSTQFTTSHAGFVATEGKTSCVILPSGASSTVWANAFAGYVRNDSSGSLNNPAVSFSADSRCNANSSQCWGFNSVVVSNNPFTGVKLWGMEIDAVPNNTTDTGAGIELGSFFNATPSGNFPAIDITGVVGSWTHGILCETAGTLGSCMQLNAVATGASQMSQRLAFFGSDSGNNARGVYLRSTQNGVLQVAAGFGANAAAFAIPTYTVSTLPTASTVGAGGMAIVTDATTFTVGTCTGGGSDYMIAVSNGTTWSCH